MSSWTFETFEKPHETNEGWYYFAEYRWNKGGAYAVHVGLAKNGVEQYQLFNNFYADKEGAKRAFKRQIKKIERGDYQ